MGEPIRKIPALIGTMPSGGASETTGAEALADVVVATIAEAEAETETDAVTGATAVADAVVTDCVVAAWVEPGAGGGVASQPISNAIPTARTLMVTTP